MLAYCSNSGIQNHLGKIFVSNSGIQNHLGKLFVSNDLVCSTIVNACSFG